MNPWRTPAERVADPPEPRHKGPRASCPACGAYARVRCFYHDTVFGLVKANETAVCPRNHGDSVGFVAVFSEPVACRFGAPKPWIIWIHLGSFAVRIPFARCHEPGLHMHQSCQVCGHAWTCDPIEPT